VVSDRGLGGKKNVYLHHKLSQLRGCGMRQERNLSSGEKYPPNAQWTPTLGKQYDFKKR
jgi:hypothetical protein